MIGKKRKDRKVSMQLRARLAQGKNVSVGAIPRLMVKLGLLKEVSASVDAISRLTNLILRDHSGRKRE